MILFLTGSDSLLSKETVDTLKQKYLAKNPEGAELIEIDESTESPNWADLRTVPLFSSSRLIVIRRVGLMTKASQEALAEVVENVPSTTVLVVWDKKALDQKSRLAQCLTAKAKVVEVETPQGEKRRKWLAKRSRELGFEVTPEAIRVLTEKKEAELWQLDTELRELALGGELDRSSHRESEPFVFFSQVRREKWDEVKQELRHKAKHGEPIELTIGSLAAAIRKECKSLPKRRQLTELLIDIDVGLKTGALDSESASALLVAHLPSPLPNRVQWEEAHQEVLGGG